MADFLEELKRRQEIRNKLFRFNDPGDNYVPSSPVVNHAPIPTPPPIPEPPLPQLDEWDKRELNMYGVPEVNIPTSPVVNHPQIQLPNLPPPVVTHAPIPESVPQEDPNFMDWLANTAYKSVVNPVQGIISAGETMRDVHNQGLGPIDNLMVNRGGQVDVTGQIDSLTRQIDEATKYNQMGAPAQFMGGVISSIPQTALNFIPGYGQVMFGTSAAGNYANEAKQMGADPNKRALYGLIGGIAEVGTNKLLDTIPGYKRIYDEAFAKGTLQSMTRRGAKEIGKDLVKQMGSEAFQEGSIDPIMGLAKKAIVDPNMPWFGQGGVVDPAQMAYDALSGAVMAGIMEGPAVPGTLSQMSQAKKYIDSNYTTALAYAEALPDGYKSKDIADEAKAKGKNVTVQDVLNLENAVKEDYQKFNKELNTDTPQAKNTNSPMNESSKFTVKNVAKEQAKQQLDEGTQQVLNYYGTPNVSGAIQERDSQKQPGSIEAQFNTGELFKGNGELSRQKIKKVLKEGTPLTKTEYDIIENFAPDLIQAFNVQDPTKPMDINQRVTRDTGVNIQQLTDNVSNAKPPSAVDIGKQQQQKRLNRAYGIYENGTPRQGFMQRGGNLLPTLKYGTQQNASNNAPVPVNNTAVTNMPTLTNNAPTGAITSSKGGTESGGQQLSTLKPKEDGEKPQRIQTIGAKPAPGKNSSKGYENFRRNREDTKRAFDTGVSRARKDFTESSYELADESTYTNHEQNLRKLANRFGLDVAFVESDSKDINGFQQDGILFVIRNKKTDPMEHRTDMQWTTGHELLHGLKTRYPDVYKGIYDVIAPTITDKQIQEYKGVLNNQDYADSLASDRDATIEEMIGDEFGNMMIDKSFWTKVLEKSKSLFNRLKKAITDMFMEIKENRMPMPWTQEQVNTLRQAIDKAINDAAKLADEIKSNEIPTLKNGTQYSARKLTPESIKQYEKEGITVPYYHNKEKSVNMGSVFAQDIEPKGEYIGHATTDNKLPNFEYGNIRFDKPLFIEYETTGHGGWKTKLSQRYGNKTGKTLTNAIVKDGYDGIITYDSKNGEIEEMVNLKGNKLPTLSTKYSARSLTDTPAFKKWFGDSKVVDKRGRPLVLYHGTDGNFNVFDINKSSTGQFGNGFYFTDDKLVSDMYRGKNGTTKEVYLSLKNPFIQGQKPNTKLQAELIDKINNAKVKDLFYNQSEKDDIINGQSMLIDIQLRMLDGGKRDDDSKYSKELTDMYKRAGYDGIIVGNEYVAFEPNQIKSVDNNGTFDPNNPDIRYSARKLQDKKQNTSVLPTLTGDNNTTGGDRMQDTKKYKFINEPLKRGKDGRIEVQHIQSYGERHMDITSDGQVLIYAYATTPKDIEDLQNHFNRDIEKYFSPLPEDVYVRVSNNPDDFVHLKRGDHHGSTNHWKVYKEFGLSVSKVSEYDAKHIYYVQGEKIATGSDGEPVLDLSTVKLISKKPMTPTQYHSDFDKKLEEKLNELGVSSKDYRELYWNSHMVQGKEDNETKYSARTLPLPKEQVEGYDKIEDADPTMNKIKERNPEIMPLIPLIKNLKNKNRLLLNLETPERNFEDMAGKDAGEFKRVLTDPVKKAEADMVRFVNNLFDDIRKFKIKAGSKESAAAQKFGEGMYVTVDKDNNVKNHKYGMDELTKDIPDARQRQNVIDYVEFMKKTYEDLFTTANEVLKRNGNREIPHRNNYFPHIQDVDGIWQSLQKAVGLENTELPTDINGLTADFSPGKPWFSHFMERTGDRTAYDAVRGADVYITGIAKVIYLTDHIKRLRNFEKAIRDVYKGQTKLSDFAAYIHEWTNILAGKQAMGDRGDEDRFGRMILRRYQAVKRNLGANLTAMNISSALSQLIPVPQILAATSKTSFLKAVADTMTSLKKDDGLGYLSDFLQRREGFDRIYKDPIQRFRDATGVPFKVIDRFTSQLALRSFYYDALKKGMNKEDAIKKADEMAGKLMAERTAGTQPVWFDSKGLFSTLTQFQLEVNNQFRFMFKDIPKEGKAKLIGFLIQMFMYDLGFNYLWEKMTGRKPAFDPIGMVLDTGRDIDNPNLNTGTKVWNGVQRVADQLPFTSTLTGGRIPLLNSLPDVQGLVKGETKIGDELWNVANLAWPFGGAGQVKKTVQGLNAYSKGKETTPAGNLRYPIEKNLPNLARGALFGKSSFPEAVDYWNMGRGPMSKAQTEEYMKAENKGKGGMDTYLGIERKTLQNQLATLKKDTKIKGEEKRKKLETLQKKLDLNMRSR